MRKRVIKSSMSSQVVHHRLGSSSTRGPGDRQPDKKVMGLEALERNEKEWSERRALLHGASGVASASALAAHVPDDADTGLGDTDVPMDDDMTITVHIPPAQKFVSHRYLRFVEPAVPFRRYDPRTWKERIQARETAWAEVMPELVNAYLAWRHRTADEAAPQPAEGATFFTIHVIRAYEFIPLFRIDQDPGMRAPVALARVGLLPCVPRDPSVAVSIDLLDFYYRIRRNAPRLGIQQFVKALCDRHEMAYHRFLRDQFAQAFDVFLAILREVDTRVKGVLNRAEPNWRVKHACPPCRYKLSGEPDLIIPGFFAVDGNFSMKRSAAAGTADPRTFVSDYRVDNASIDLYANEVKTRARVTELSEDASSENVRVDTLNEPGEPGDDAPPTPCTLRWKAAKADQYKVAPGVFDQTGIYPALCRHGLVMCYCEMRRSGELAKYPLGIFARIMDMGLAPLTGAADIGCALQGTLSRSSLGARAQQLGLRVRMNSFHGYGHNRLCQLTDHPLYIDGFGLEDLETCERFFARSNHVAGGVRHASHFHYLQFIDMFMAAWDEEKYAALSTFLCNNVVQAMQIIDEFEPVLEEFKTSRGLTDAVIEGWRDEEREYLEALKKEPEEDVLAMDYVEALRELDAHRQKVDTSTAELESGFIIFNPADMANTSRASLAKRATKKKKAHTAYMAAIANVESLERVLKIDVRWSPESDEYKATLEKIRLRDYLRAVDRLELLMLQRMFELQKTHALGTGYKMREAIGKNIKARSKAIGTAVKNYNEAAADLTPPGPPVDFSTLMEWTELQEFELLRLARRGDVRDRDWSKPVNREAAVRHYKVKRAHEELLRCKVEIRRLYNSMRDEDAELTRVLDDLRLRQHSLVGEVAMLRRRRLAVNAEHMARFARLRKKPGMASFMDACLVPLTRDGVPPSTAVPSDPTAQNPLTGDGDDQDSGEELDDDLAEQVLAVQDYIGGLDS